MSRLTSMKQFRDFYVSTGNYEALAKMGLYPNENGYFKHSEDVLKLMSEIAPDKDGCFPEIKIIEPDELYNQYIINQEQLRVDKAKQEEIVRQKEIVIQEKQIQQKVIQKQEDITDNNTEEGTPLESDMHKSALINSMGEHNDVGTYNPPTNNRKEEKRKLNNMLGMNRNNNPLATRDKRITVRLGRDLYDRLIARLGDQTVSKVIKRLVKNWINKNPIKKKGIEA